SLTDEDIQPEPEPDLTEPDIQDMISNITKSETVQEVPVPTVFKGAITRQRAKVLQHKFNESMILASDLGQVKLADEPSLKQDELKGAEPVKEKQASTKASLVYLARYNSTAYMGESSEQATMMQVLNALREEMRVMRQDLGERMTRVEQRPPPLQPVRNVDRFLNPNNRRYGVPVHDNPETSTRNQQTDEDTGQQPGPIPNQRAGLQPDDYGEEEEEEGNITKSETVQEVPVPTVFKGAITRQRAKVLQHKFNESMILASDLGQVKLADEPSLKQDELKGAEPVKEKQASKNPRVLKVELASFSLPFPVQIPWLIRSVHPDHPCVRSAPSLLLGNVQPLIA
ncbi:hypothetical protein IGI04_035212, partial [Brassica rapa subsp. trilocularis]